LAAPARRRILAAIEATTTAVKSEQRALLADALKLASLIERTLLASGAARRVERAGALRRFEGTVTALDLVVTCADDEARVWQCIARLPSVQRVNRERCSAQLDNGLGLRLTFTEAERFGTRWLFATGPQDHVAALQARAKQRALALTHDGVFARTGRVLDATQDEVALYRALGLAFIPPELRTAHIDEACAYDDLLRVEHVQGLVHCHTDHSDGKNTIEEMALAAQALGMAYITITDHSPSAHYARGVTVDRLQRQWDEIARVQEFCDIRILRGAESDILADGSLDYPDSVLEQLDVVIASIHERFKMDRAQMTARLVRALGLPVFKIWGHALGRLLLSREPIDCDVPAVLDALASSRGAIEVNGDPQRLDLPPEWIPAAREREIAFVVSVDAHSTAALRGLPLGVGTARRGGLRRREVLNTLSAEDFAARVRPML
jgi:DNA polymerase (family X)